MIFSEKTSSQISEICLKNGLAKEKTIEQIAYYITSVLLSNLPIRGLAKALVTNLKIDTKIAEKISEETNRLIFSQVKNELAQFNKTPPLVEEKPKKSPSKDVYRELLE